MGQINSLPSIVLAAHNPAESKAKKDSTKHKQQEQSPPKEEPGDEQQQKPQDDAQHIDLKG